jgi:hypothetical protein
VDILVCLVEAAPSTLLAALEHTLSGLIVSSAPLVRSTPLWVQRMFHFACLVLRGISVCKGATVNSEVEFAQRVVFL